MRKMDALRACRTNRGKRYLSTDDFYDLDVIRRVEAYLWMCWPEARTTRNIQTVCKMGERNSALTNLKKSNTIIHVSKGLWRYKPKN